MVFVLKKNATEEKIGAFVKKLESAGFSTFLSTGTEHTVVCLIGNTAKLDVDFIVQTNEIVEYGRRVTEPYKAVNRTVHSEDTHIKVGGVTLGEGFFQVISGPCSVESEEQIIRVARSVKESGAALLRGGASAGRRVQAAHLALFLPGSAGRGAAVSACCKAGDGHAHRHGGHEPDPTAAV